MGVVQGACESVSRADGSHNVIQTEGSKIWDSNGTQWNTASSAGGPKGSIEGTVVAPLVINSSAPVVPCGRSMSMSSSSGSTADPLMALRRNADEAMAEMEAAFNTGIFGSGFMSYNGNMGAGMPGSNGNQVVVTDGGGDNVRWASRFFDTSPVENCSPMEARAASLGGRALSAP
eukprot:gnl/TRDRNA2_/TRDRNA2_193581_c0_seq1.p1 gnl/TRDRNA2_/TRDRNA2_193581_c0~~gnl/TRDRNA2_/TRDRNA2_193581_c0_seq1.p1  ORF type:complete len:175 (+),score=31.30 gnl/TRDRNA2_/TRDRNA2_193581_c0_seq1:123-647(+)